MEKWQHSGEGEAIRFQYDEDGVEFIKLDIIKVIQIIYFAYLHYCLFYQCQSHGTMQLCNALNDFRLLLVGK